MLFIVTHGGGGSSDSGMQTSLDIQAANLQDHLFSRFVLHHYYIVYFSPSQYYFCSDFGLDFSGNYFVSYLMGVHTVGHY